VAVAAMVAAMVTMALNAQTGMVAKYTYGNFFTFIKRFIFNFFLIFTKK